MKMILHLKQNCLHALERMESKELIALRQNHSNSVQEIKSQNNQRESILNADLCHGVIKTQEWHQELNAMLQVKCLVLHKNKIRMIRKLLIQVQETLKLRKIKHKLNQSFQYAMERMESKVLTAEDQKETHHHHLSNKMMTLKTKQLQVKMMILKLNQ